MSVSNTIVQEAIIASSPQSIFEELLIWGESSWWPKKSLMQFINLSGKREESSVYLQKTRLPLGPSWHTRNEVIDPQSLHIRRIYLDGMFEGFEELSVEKLKDNAFKAVYKFSYHIKGLINKIMWNLMFKRLHIKNIDLILGSLKRYLETK